MAFILNAGRSRSPFRVTCTADGREPSLRVFRGRQSAVPTLFFADGRVPSLRVLRTAECRPYIFFADGRVPSLHFYSMSSVVQFSAWMRSSVSRSSLETSSSCFCRVETFTAERILISFWE